jgi:tRNA(fMet)-specific endonuclease VapC
MIDYCFDTDIISATLKPRPPLHLLRRLATIPAQHQFVTAITVGELVYGAHRVDRPQLTSKIELVLRQAQTVLPFDTTAASTYGSLRVQLERAGTPLAEPDLRIASIAVARGLVLVSRNIRHFQRIPGLVVENWIDQP